MKKWMYLLFPGLMLGIFLIFWFAHEKDSAERDHVRLEKQAEKQAADKKTKDEAEQKARLEAAERQKQREEDERKKEEARQAKMAAADKQVKDLTDTALADGDKSQKTINGLELDIDRLHKQKDDANRRLFDLQKQVELARVAKQNAELEEQRMTEMIARRTADTTLAQMPPAPPPPPAGK